MIHVLLIQGVLLLLLQSLLQVSSYKHVRHQNTVGCYKCHSFNGSDAHCGDPFHPAFNMGRYHGRCEQGMDNRVGMFPARYCTKIKGTNLKTNEELIVRSCSMSAFDNACGLFEYQNTRYSGCLMSCSRDACNIAGRPGRWTRADGAVIVTSLLALHMGIRLS